MRVIALLVAVTTIVACRQDLASGLTASERIVVLRYLDCIDCVEELDSVRALGMRKPEATVDTLNHGLLNGPGPESVAAAESVLVIGYVRDSIWRAQNGRPPLPLRLTYISDARDRYVNGYRARGAFGMGWIRTTRAVQLLDSASALPMPTYVKWAVIYSRDSLPPP